MNKKGGNKGRKSTERENEIKIRATCKCWKEGHAICCVLMKLLRATAGNSHWF
jgi:hypothetical protein